MRPIIQFDKDFFFLINNKWHNLFFDSWMPLLRHANFWVPLYLFLFVLVLSNFKKNVFWWACFAGVMVILTNFISSDLIKENIFRLRPCNDNNLVPPARLLLSYKPQSSSFTSSHACNHFALAVFFYMTLKNHVGNWAKLFFIWAFIVIYAQVYVGVHYPLDVISGALVGIVFGYLSAYIFNKKYLLA
ncbi:MAG: phosphatase PAP2 family protein [Ferruginibacter sp.]